MNVGPVQIVIIALVILILFGRGRISEMMGDFGKGVKSFRQGLADEAAEPKDSSSASQAQITRDAASASETADTTTTADKPAS